MHYPPYKIFDVSYLSPVSDLRCDWVNEGRFILRREGSAAQYRLYRAGTRLKLKTISDRLLQQGKAEYVDAREYLAMPSFVDTHFHWVQDDVRHAPKDNLLQWLSRYTWPHEAKYVDVSYSRAKAHQFAHHLTQVGTLAGACYASIHPHTVDHALKYFIGDFVVGNVLMTMNSPAYLNHSARDACRLIDRQVKRFGRHFAVTPRFAPTTHPEVMSYAAQSAQKNKLFVQTHLSENKQEISYVLDIYRHLPGFEDVKTYSDIYHRCRLLGPRTIMGHAIHLSPAEWRLLAKTKTAIAHCPTSNAPIRQLGLGSGLFNYRLANRYRVPWSLASDIGGGPYLSMLDVMHSFVKQQKHHGATHIMALHRATLAGAKILGLRDQGTFSQGNKMWANFILLPRPEKINAGDNAEGVIQKLLRPLMRQRALSTNMVEKTFFRGTCVFNRADMLKK